MKKARLIFLLLVLVSLAGSSVYYVDATNGSDDFSGLMPSGAWQSILKVNNALLLPGDSVLFKRGERFRGNLFPKSGSDAGWVSYGAYGSGAKPLFLGSIQKNDEVDWIKTGENIWTTSQQKALAVGPELLANPDFSTNFNSWESYTEGGASCTFSRTTITDQYYNPPGGGQLTCSNNGIVSSDIQIFSSPLVLNSSKWVRLQFKAKASQSFTIPEGRIKLFKNSAPFTAYTSTGSKAVRVLTEWNNFNVFFKVSISVIDARLDFLLGNAIPDGESLFLDSLSLRELDSDPGLIEKDVGNIIFNDEALCGTKVKSETDLNSQGEFWYDANSKEVKLFSVLNPALYYSNLELALNKYIIDDNNASYVVYDNLDLRYGAAHGIGGANSHHISIKSLDMSYIGGGILYEGVRFGNGIEFWEASHDIIVERCSFSQIYDAALTVQGLGDNAPYQAYNIVFRNNIVRNSEYSFEFWGRPTQSVLHDISFENNTCLDAGVHWGHNQRFDDPNGTHLMIWGLLAQTSNISIRNNIFSNSTEHSIRFTNLTEVSKVQMDYNCWFESSGPIANLNGSFFDFNTEWNNYKVASGQDTHSIAATPLLNADFSLGETSPCVNAGTLVAVSDDFNQDGRPVDEAYDIGAFEYQGKVLFEDKRNDSFLDASLLQCFPNPFNPTTVITVSTVNFNYKFDKLAIYDIHGKEIANLSRSLKNGKAIWDASELSAGVYFVRMQTTAYSKFEKIVLLK